MAHLLRGVFTPHLIPLDARGDIHESELRRYIDWLIERGVHGLYPNGSTGEFTRFTALERRRIIAIVCDQVRGRIPVLAGAAEATIRETIDACAAYKECGATAVAIVSPFYFKLGSESIYAYFREIAQQSPIDVTLYNIPAFASPMDVPTIQRLAELPRIIGIKDSSGDISFVARLLAAIRPARPDFAIFNGWDAAMVPMMVMGVDGSIHASSGVVPEITRQLYDLTTAGKLDQAVPLQLRLIELFDAMLTIDFPQGFRAGVTARGFDFARGRQPLSEKQSDDVARLGARLSAMMRDLGIKTH